MPECGHSSGCRIPKTNYCDDPYPDMMSTETPFSFKGAPLARFASLGTFAEFNVIKETHFAKVRRDAPLDVLCLICCGVATGIGSVLDTAKVSRGSAVIVIGLGGIGLNVLQGARPAGAKRSIGVDVNATKANAAQRCGATEFVNAGDVGGVTASRSIRSMRDTT